jgi:ubiquitin carboxyl-terminal hydrolase L5
LIFLFKWQQTDTPTENLVNDSRLDEIFFARQVITNACATQAIVSVLLNCTHEDLKLGSTLGEFKEFAQAFDPQVCTEIKKNISDMFIIDARFNFIQ